MISPAFHMFFSLFRISMGFVEDIRVSQERAKTGFCAEIDRPAAILDARKICWISIAELSSTEGDEAWVFFA